MNQYNRLLDPKKDIGRYSGTLAIYLLVMTLVTVLWEVLLGLTLAGSLRKDPSQVTEKLNALNVWAGIPYLISISIGLFLFNAYRKKALYWSNHRRILLPWGRFARLGTVWQNLCHCHDGYFIRPLPCQF